MAKIHRQHMISHRMVTAAALPPKLFTALSLIEQGAPLRITPKRFDVDDLDDDEVEFLGDITSYEYPEWDATIYEWDQELNG